MDTYEHGVLSVKVFRWDGFAQGMGKKVHPHGVGVKWVPEEVHDANPMNVCVAEGLDAHFLVQSRPDVEDGKLVAYQLRDVRMGDGTIVVAVGRANGVLDPTAYAAIHALFYDYLEPTYNVRAPDILDSEV